MLEAGGPRSGRHRLLGDVLVDYVEGFDGAGFAFADSKATDKCPCAHHDLLA